MVHVAPAIVLTRLSLYCRFGGGKALSFIQLGPECNSLSGFVLPGFLNSLVALLGSH